MAMTKTKKTSITDVNIYKWTVSASGTNEYYVTLLDGSDPAFLAEPTTLTEEGVALSAGTVGSLTAGTWDWADNDSLGFSTVYVRLTANGPDPDDEIYDYLVATITETVSDSNMEIFDGILLASDFPIVPKTITTATYTNVLAADSTRRLVQITNEDTVAIFVCFQSATPSNTNVMRSVAVGETVWFSALDGMPTATMWAYHSKGSNAELKVASASV